MYLLFKSTQLELRVAVTSLEDYHIFTFAKT